jgi:hypothetical protein
MPPPAAEASEYGPCEACRVRHAEFWHKAGAAVCFTCFELDHDAVCALLNAQPEPEAGE